MKSTKSFAIVLILLSMVSCTTGKEFDFDNSKLTIESLVKQYNLELAEQITKYLKGKLSPEEEVELKKRLHAHPEGEQLLARVQDERSIAAKKEMYASFSADKSWERIRKVTGFGDDVPDVLVGGCFCLASCCSRLDFSGE